MRVLAFTPTYGDLLRPETVESVAGQVFAGEIYHEVSRYNPYPPPDSRNVLAQYERARGMVLADEYDALWTVEHDIRCGPDALQKLWDTAAPVAYGVYRFRSGNIINAMSYYPGARNMGESLSRGLHILAPAARKGIVPVSGVGFGCTLIRREVLERVPFRSGEKGTEPPDIPFAVDCLRKGIKQVAHFGVICGHWNGERWLVPWIGIGETDYMETVEVEAKQNVVALVSGGSLELIAGRRYRLLQEDAHELARAGFVTLVAQEAERAVPPEAEKAVGRGQRRKR